jgi:hypothetical protein
LLQRDKQAKAYACCNGIIGQMARKASITKRHLRRASCSALVVKRFEVSVRASKMIPLAANRLCRDADMSVENVWYLGHDWTFLPIDD